MTTTRRIRRRGERGGSPRTPRRGEARDERGAAARRSPESPESARGRARGRRRSGTRARRGEGPTGRGEPTRETDAHPRGETDRRAGGGGRSSAREPRARGASRAKTRACAERARASSARGTRVRRREQRRPGRAVQNLPRETTDRARTTGGSPDRLTTQTRHWFTVYRSPSRRRGARLCRRARKPMRFSMLHKIYAPLLSLPSSSIVTS